MINASTIVSATLDLSTGVTLFTSPSCIALKQHSHDAPVAKPESARNTSVFVSTAASVACEPARNTIAQANMSTTIVRIAVASDESVLRIPALTSIAVTPAKSAEPNA
ncbi:hypothetical protein SDC9_188690 [bioreactor metagenome]|uniref:Uncharacterized protein n=1 Tax=bioreactor metagenome TaxID=1076179 RepID=A0A645HQ20_9ZZZZ